MIRSLHGVLTATYRRAYVVFSIDEKFVGMLRQDNVTDAGKREGRRERERARPPKTRPSSRRLSAYERREAFSRARLGMRPLPRPASRRSHGAASSFLSAAATPLARSADRSASVSLARRDRNNRALYYVSSINCEYRAGRTTPDADPIRGMPHPSHE